MSLFSLHTTKTFATSGSSSKHTFSLVLDQNIFSFWCTKFLATETHLFAISHQEGSTIWVMQACSQWAALGFSDREGAKQLWNLTGIYLQPLLLLPSLYTPAQALLSLPHKAAQRTSELNFFLYLRISGLSLCGRIFVGLTLTTEPFLAFSLLTGSGFALDAGKEDMWNHKKCKCLATSHIWPVHGRMKQIQRGKKTIWEALHNQREDHTYGKLVHSWASEVEQSKPHLGEGQKQDTEIHSNVECEFP